MKTIFKIFASVIAFSTLAISVSAAGFAKTQDYPDGKFTDVSSGKWYAAEVKSSYELGLMNGQSDTLFAPEGNVTVAEGITMASRVHSIYNGKTIAEKNGGKWYDMYIAYATENGLIAEGQFTNYDRNIMRYEMAVMFAKAMPKSHFTAKNEIKDIPDVAKTEEYYDDLMMLYRAGVVMGSDDYGNFYATNPITRSETAAIINRVALPENRKSGTLLEYGNRDAAVFLIDDPSFGKAPHSGVTFGSGWLYEDTGSQSFNSIGEYVTNISDTSEKNAVFAHRDIEVQERGVVKAELSITVTGNGAKAMFFDSNKNTFLEIVHKNGSIFVLGDKEYDTGYKIKAGLLKFYLELDLDNEKIFVSINGTDAGTYSTKPIMNFARFSFGTEAENTASIGLGYVHMYTNYDVYDVFRYTPEGQKPYGWNVTGNAVITPVNSAYDIGGVKITDAGKITKKFSPVGDKFVYETFLLVPKGQPAYVALMNGNKEAVKVTATADGKFVCGNTTLREFDNRVWQLIRVEADTASNKAVIKINGKKFGTVDFNEDATDEIVIAFEGKGKMLVDDVELYNVFDYADYCPVPVPVNDDEWYVGMSVCSLWREGTHFGWQYIDGYDDIEPIMGYYDEGIAEVADWEIKFLSEHGYDFMHYCWYVGNQGKEPIKNTRMGAALTDGYLNAKYSDMLDFSIMWENNNCNFADSKYFYDVVWPYWCEWYFSDERYMRIDNKAVFTIYLYENFITHMGGEDKAKEVIAFMKDDIKRYGYDGMIILCMNTSNKPADAKKITELGVDARVAYHLGENGYKADYQIMRTEELFNMEAVTYLPSVGIGFNDIGWTQVRTPLATPEEHKRMLEWAKNTYMPKVAEKEEEEWYSKFVIANTWNEYGEGHYIMPTSLNEFGYVDANRAVFSSAAGKNDAKHFDVKPTDNQKDRLVNMHSGAHTSMKKQGYVEDKFDLNKAEKIYTFNFEDEAVCQYWKGTNVKDFGYNSVEKALCGEAATNDACLRNTAVEGMEIDADIAKFLRIVMKYDGGDFVSGNLFFLNEGDKEFTGKKGFAFTSAVKKDEYFEIVIDLSDNEFWKGKIKNLRFDPCNVLGGKFAVKSLEFISSIGPDDLKMDIDGYILAVPKNCITKKNGEIYVAGNPADGFYSLQNMYYEYNRKTGRFFLKTSTNTEFEFTVGSDKVKVNGETKSLNEKLELYEGLVKLPLCFVYDNSGIEYTWNENNMAVTVREKVPDNEENESKEYCWEFNKSGDFENWVLEMATGGVDGGKIYMQASPVASSKYGYDPVIKNTAVYMDASYYTSIDIRLKTEFTGDINGTEVSVYFTTNSDSKLNEAKSVKIDLAKLTTDADGFYNINASMKENANWKGYITTLRIDPTNNGGYYEFDYIRCVIDPEKEEALAVLMAEKENDEVLLKTADEGAPFYIKNPDGQSITGTFNATSSNATVTLVQDPDNSENMAYLTVPTVKDRRSWTYFYIPTRFKPGVTYKVEYDVKVIGDRNGNAVTSASLVPNLRYTDYAQDGTLKVKMDHPITKNAIKTTTGDGWIHCSFEHTVSAKSPERLNDFFAIYSEPQGTNEAPVNIAFMVDNIVVTVVDAGGEVQNGELNHEVQTPTESGTSSSVILVANPAYSWEFDKDDKAQKWYEYYAETEIKDGKLCMTATPTSGGKYDPQISKGSMSIDAAANPAIKIRLKAILAEGAKDKTVTIYFTTDSDSTLNGAKTVKINLNTLTPDAEGFYDLTFDMSSNENWKGTVTRLRLDPTGSNGYFEIDYIRVITVS